MKHSPPVQPSLEDIQGLLAQFQGPKAPNLVPMCATLPADLLTPCLAYLKLSSKAESGFSFLFESAEIIERVSRYSFVGADPRKVIKTGPDHVDANPLPILAEELCQYREATVPDMEMPPLAGGAIGYVGYDCVRYFEPSTARHLKEPLKDVLKVPEALFMLFDTIVAFDHFYQVIKVISYLHVPPTSPGTSLDASSEAPSPDLAAAYARNAETIHALINTLLSPETPLPPQPPIPAETASYVSNIGRAGYEAHVRTLKMHIERGDIIQAVPSQRFARPTALHPFNLYRHLRTVNPSPYLFYISLPEFAIVGASPELLVRAPTSGPDAGRIVSHPIAGTARRGKSAAEDAALAAALASDAKEHAEHVMLVDLARNDVNRVCSAASTGVDFQMAVHRFSHVQHLVSQVSGELRAGKTRFDAFESIFPAGTVSGAPKVRAMQLVAGLEGEKRGVYAGAVGYWGYDTVQKDDSGEAVLREGPMDTCIALRTMVVKDGVAYLQAGGGIVYDSDPYAEWVETINKVGSNVQCIEGAEERYGGVSREGDWRDRVEGWEDGKK